MNELTLEQNKAIDSDKKLIVVSASAGTGKTTVLVNRIKRLLLDGISLKNLLVVTFTNNSANEMKNRLKFELENDNKLKSQLFFLDNCLICTIDEFCL